MNMHLPKGSGPQALGEGHRVSVDGQQAAELRDGAGRRRGVALQLIQQQPLRQQQQLLLLLKLRPCHLLWHHLLPSLLRARRVQQRRGRGRARPTPAERKTMPQSGTSLCSWYQASPVLRETSHSSY